MTIDVVCAGAPYLDITFTGLTGLPALGEERLAERVQITPGGLANVAFGLTRLGLKAAIWSPVGDDLSGRVLAELLAGEEIAWLGPRAHATAVSVIMPLDGDRAFVTVTPELPVDPAALAALHPRAVVIDLPAVGQAPPNADVYAVVGDVDARALAGRLPTEASMARALIVNEQEAMLLSGSGEVVEAARILAGVCPTVVVTRGKDGALVAGEDGIGRATAPAVIAVDTNGAGDLFTAAWVWADLAGLPVSERLRLAVAYASLSVRVPTTRAGALGLEEFLAVAGPIRERIPPNGAR